MDEAAAEAIPRTGAMIAEPVRNFLLQGWNAGWWKLGLFLAAALVMDAILALGWEYSHAVNAVITFVSLALISLSRRQESRGRVIGNDRSTSASGWPPMESRFHHWKSA